MPYPRSYIGSSLYDSAAAVFGTDDDRLRIITKRADVSCAALFFVPYPMIAGGTLYAESKQYRRN